MRRLAIITGLSILVFFSNLDGISIYILDEAKNATCAREMYDRGDLVVPTFNGELRTEKPPLHYYFMMSAYAIGGGATPFTARFFSALMGVLTVLLIYFYTRHYRNETAAFYASLVMLSSLMVGIQFHLSTPDPYLIFFMVLGSLLLFQGYDSRKIWPLLGGYACLGLGFLAKGPIAVALPVLGIILFLVAQLSFSWPNIKRFAPWWGALMVLVIIFPWYYLVGVKTDGVWLEEFFLKQNVERFTSTMEGHGGFPLSAVVILLAALLPFSVFIPQSVKQIWKARQYDQFSFFALFSGAAIVFFFLFSQTILPSYISPALPYFAICLGSYLAKAESTEKFRAGLPLMILLGITILLPVAGYVGLAQDKGLSHLTSLAFWLVILPLGAVIALILHFRNSTRRALYVLSGSFILTFLAIMYIVFPPIDRTNPVRHSVAILEAHSPAIYYYERMNSAYAFAYGKVIPKIKTEEGIDSVLRHNPEAIIITREDKIKDLMQGKSSVEVFRHKDLFDAHTTLIFTGKQNEDQGLVSDN